MAVIHLGIHLCAALGACDLYAFGIDHHNIIPHLHARREGRFVFAKQDLRDTCGNAPKGFSLGIHKYPLTFNFASFRIVRLVHFLISVSFLIDQLTQWTDTSLRQASAREREPIPQGFFRFPSQPEPALLKNGRYFQLKAFPVQPPPGQIPAFAPFDTKMRQLVLRSATRLSQRGLASIQLSSRSARLCLWEWSGNQRQQNRVSQAISLHYLQGYCCPF